ncbi:MAG: zf-HC2 domain-containing protein [Acidobacteriia bacterium]|nr:zf-HC2 domain-containing protein [Terriglobia bacterium]
MNCPIKTQKNKEWLLEYSAGRLDNERAARVARHLAMCPECARFVEAQRGVWQALSQWEPEPVSADFDRRLYSRIESQPATWLDRLFRPLQPLWHAAIPVAAACLLIVASVVLHTPQAPQVTVEKIEAEQVERTLDDMQMLRELALTPKPEGSTSKSM